MNTLRVLGIAETPRARELVTRWLYYKQAQSDHLGATWDGYLRKPGETYLVSRMRGIGVGGSGFVPATSESIPFGSRRPTCPTMICGQVVDTYTALLLGEGRQPAIRVIGDSASTELIEALLKHSDSWDGLAEARKIAGAEGAAAVIPEIVDGQPCLRALRPEHLYCEWTAKKDWVPALVIEQKRVDVERLDPVTGKIATARVWRTRAWDDAFAYIYEDIVDTTDAPDDEDKDPDSDKIVLVEDPKAHGVGRCPVVWLQNTRDSDDPIGEADCAEVYEQIDGLDQLQSMLLRGSKANVDPTLMVKDKEHLLRKNRKRKKGYGAAIEVSEVGDAKLLEIAGSSVEASWLSYDKIRRQVDLRTGVVTVDPENVGNVISGTALKLLGRTQDMRAAARRRPLDTTISQVVAVWLDLVRAHGVKIEGAEGPGVALPPMEIESQDEREDGEAVTTVDLQVHEVGPGGAISLDWPGFHSATPQDLDQMARALSLMTGGKPVLSQETAVGIMSNMAETSTDPAAELARIEAETASKMDEFESSMLPDVDEPEDDLDVDETLDEAGVPKKDVQDLALNGAQTKALFDALMAVGATIAPDAAAIGLPNAFPVLDAQEVRGMIDAQVAFIAQQKADAPEPPPIEGAAAQMPDTLPVQDQT